MRSFNPYYIIGTIGLMATIIFHIVLTVLVAQPWVHPVFVGLYPIFLSFFIPKRSKLKPVMQKIPIEKKRIK